MLQGQTKLANKIQLSNEIEEFSFKLHTRNFLKVISIKITALKLILIFY